MTKHFCETAFQCPTLANLSYFISCNNTVIKYFIDFNLCRPLFNGYKYPIILTCV
jgi:hypothetical protein